MTNHELHQMLWGELAIMGYGSKISTETYQKHHAPNSCYACAEAGYAEDEDGEFKGSITEDCCPKCPIDWGIEPVERRCTCEVDGSPYRVWMYSPDKEERKKLAAIIRDLPWRKK